MNDEELQANGSAVQSSTSPASSSSIQARLATLFPTVGSNRASRKDTSRRPAKSKRTIKSTKGRPSMTLAYKDLVVIPVSIKQERRTTDYGLRTGCKTRTGYKTRTKRYGLGIKYGLRYKTPTEHYGLSIKHEERFYIE